MLTGEKVNCAEVPNNKADWHCQEVERNPHCLRCRWSLLIYPYWEINDEDHLGKSNDYPAAKHDPVVLSERKYSD